jgi:hypothetical protein
MIYTKGFMLIILGLVYIINPFIIGRGYCFRLFTTPSYLSIQIRKTYVRTIALGILIVGIIIVVFDNTNFILGLIC